MSYVHPFAPVLVPVGGGLYAGGGVYVGGGAEVDVLQPVVQGGLYTGVAGVVGLGLVTSVLVQTAVQTVCVPP